MADFLVNNGPGSSVLQPQSVRSRSRFRGPRESHKMNLEDHQFYYDIMNLRGRTEYTQELDEQFIGYIYGQNDLLDTHMQQLQVSWEGETEEPFSDFVSSLPELAARVEALIQKLQYSKPTTVEFDIT